MKKKLHIHWDAEGDFLEIRVGEATPAYYEEIGNDVFCRRDKKTSKITGYALFNVQKQQSAKDVEVDFSTLIEA
jgi:hypothetical protein